MKRLLIYFSFLLLGAISINAQELNAKVSINSSKIQGISKDIFTDLENILKQMLNETKWTQVNFGQNEKIDCTFAITINSVEEGSKFKGEIQLTSRRPVYNSTYVSPIFNFRDTEIAFEYTQGEQLEYNETMVTNNLVGVVSFYVYVILGLDFDSFAENGGKSYFEQALNIANAAQSLGEEGWAAFSSNKNRYALALALTEESSRSFHPMWYNYHRKGLDDMAANSSRGRIQIFQTLTELDELYQARPSSVLLLMYGDTKLSEVVSILEQSNTEEKKEVMEILNKIYPTKSSIINGLKK